MTSVDKVADVCVHVESALSAIHGGSVVSPRRLYFGVDSHCSSSTPGDSERLAFVALVLTVWCD